MEQQSRSNIYNLPSDNFLLGKDFHLQPHASKIKNLKKKWIFESILKILKDAVWTIIFWILDILNVTINE